MDVSVHNDHPHAVSFFGRNKEDRKNTILDQKTDRASLIGIRILVCLESRSRYRTNLIFIVAVFGAVYFLASTIRYFIEKKQTDAMTDALLQIQKEIEKENE